MCIFKLSPYRTGISKLYIVFLITLFSLRPLKFGVRVIAAHCGTEGHAVDFDARDRPRIPCFELFLRLMRVDA